MKRILKGTFLPVFLAIVIGYIGGRYVYHIYNDNLYDNLTSSRLYLIENGEYDSISAMREENITNNYLYYKDDDKYKSVVGITKKFDNISKIKKLYNDNLSVMEYYAPDGIINSKQDEYDDILYNITDTDEVKKVVDNILDLYRNDNSIRLIAIN